MIVKVLTNCIAIWSNNYRIDFFDKEEGGSCLFAFCHAGDFIDQRWRCIDYDIEFNFNEHVQNIYSTTQALLKEVRELGESHDVSIVGRSKSWIFRLNSDPEMLFNVCWRQGLGWKIDTDHGYSLSSNTEPLSCLLRQAMKEDFGAQPTVRERLANVLLPFGWTEAIGAAGYYFRFCDDVYIYPGSDSLYMTSKKGDIDVNLSEADKMSGEEILETLRVRCIKSLGLS